MKFLASISLCLLIFNSTVNAQTPVWNWASSGLDVNDAYVSSVATDDSGNTFIAGFYNIYWNFSVSSPLLTFQNAQYTANGPGFGFPISFVSKLDQNGEVAWLRLLGGSNNNPLWNPIAVDKWGNVYIGVNFQGDAKFGDTTITSIGDCDFTIIKFNANGEQIWAKNFGTPYLDNVLNMFIDDDQKIIIGGYIAIGTSSATIYPTIQFDTIALPAYGNGDAFIARLDTNGVAVKARLFGSTNHSDMLVSASSTKGCGYYIAIYLGSSATLDGFFVPASAARVFLKLDSNFSVQWIKTMTINSGATPWAYCTSDATGNMILIGGNDQSFANVVDGVSLAGDMSFVARFSPSGQLLWAKDLGNHNQDQALSVVCDSSNNIYIGGHFKGPLVVGQDSVHSVGSQDDIMIVKLDSNGNHIWTKMAGGNGTEWTYSIALHKNGDVAWGGFVSSSGPTFGPYVLPDALGWDLAVARLGFEPSRIGESIPKAESPVSAWPNPAADILHLSTVGSAITSGALLIDMAGHQHTLRPQAAFFPSKSATYDVSALPSGLYTLLITDAKGKLRATGQKVTIAHP